MAEQKVVMTVEDAEGMKENLQRMQDELAKVRDKAKEEAESLDRIRGMIDLNYLNRMMSVIATLETRVKTMEKDSGASLLRKELAREQERLAKLWDAFKSQEDELKAAMKDRDALTARFTELDKAFKSMGSVVQARSKVSHLERENTKLANELRKSAEAGDDYRRRFDQERQRLAKLFKVYEDTAASRGDHKREAEALRALWGKYQPKLPPAAKKAASRIRRAK